MRTGLKVAWSVAFMALALAACAQSPALPAPSVQGGIFREICDPNSGNRWLLIRNDAVPGGPGRLVLVADHPNQVPGPSERQANRPQPANQHDEARFHPVIHAGDRLIVEEHTAVADAALEARALIPATLGSALEVRLTIGGRVVRAVALGPGRAALQPETGVRPWD